jgi:hypothetical protein
MSSFWLGFGIAFDSAGAGFLVGFLFGRDR